MMKPCPSILALRALNQYRHRDVVSYLGLRYLLENSAAKSERWAREVAIENVLKRTDAPYYPVQHFKGIDEAGQVEHRAIHLPSPQEALAECALIAAIHEGHATFPHESVYSYMKPQDGSDCSGPFARYFPGLKKRHEQIARACELFPDGIVQYVDIKKCYPSISIKLATDSWSRLANDARITDAMRECGSKILSDYGRVQQSAGIGLLTGPVFSHLIANAVLHEVDLEFALRHDVVYMRYVDDIVLVGPAERVRDACADLEFRLSDMGLSIHGPESSKTFSIATKEWLVAKDDYAENAVSIQWRDAVGALRRNLVTRSGQVDQIRSTLIGEGFRIPLLDYSGVIGERTYLERLKSLLKLDWLPWGNKSPSIEYVVVNFSGLRYVAQRDFESLLDRVDLSDPWQRKRFIPKLRFLLGRMLFVAEPAVIAQACDAVSGIPELRFHWTVGRSVVTGEIGEALEMGANVTQAIAQLMRSGGEPVIQVPARCSSTAMHSLAVLALNGVRTQGNAEAPTDFLRFAQHGPTIEDFSHPDPFLAELFCLHGAEAGPRHSTALSTAFDYSDDLTFDAIEQFKGSAS